MARNLLDDLIGELENARALLSPLENVNVRIMQWVDVKERLPEDTESADYLVTRAGEQGVSEPYVQILDACPRRVLEIMVNTGEITHWMPLPEPARSA